MPSAATASTRCRGLVAPTIGDVKPPDRRALHPDPRLPDEPRRGPVLHYRTQAIHHGTFGSVKQLNTKIRQFIDGWNDRAHPFVWTKPADQILTKTNRQTTSDAVH